ncbi:hypothetical protein BAE44_0026259 [Dichanthelium oligosanthes]|uniref:Uncharacterized protein n=1 Tax=Dichanthelium oligosanthes TaxID=888268 RepID=A0A1E5UIM4_9POAL|nr:hypothetical protein BAE44_0026259 [Dichanthelium oligosanthes]
MDEEWRELGRTTVPDTLLRVAKGTVELLGTVDSAQRKLSAFIHVVLSLQRGDADAINWDDVREQPNAGTMLDDAHGELVRLRELHHMASQVFVLYGTRLQMPGLDVDSGPLWQTWQGHSGETFGHALRALQSLRSAASHVRASRDALLMARSLLRLSPDDWAAWVSAALNLWRRATWEATKAMVSARRMRDAVTVELEDVWRVLNR